MHKPQFRSTMVILGILTALVIVFSQVFYYQGADYCATEKKIDPREQEGQTEQGESGDDHISFISLPSSTVLSSFQPAFQHPAVFLFEIVSSEESTETWVPEISVFLGKYFQTLFHIIISPNAP